MTAPLDLTAPINLVTIRVPGMQGPLGETGPVNVLSIGTVSTTAAGTSATASITGTAPAQVLNLTVPRGDKGDTGNTGPANSLAVGTVTTGAPGSAASFTITGTAPSQTLNLTIPRGDVGQTGPANSLSVGTVTTGAAGSAASFTITGTAPNQTLNLTIPRGNTGATGSAALMTIGTVTTGAAGSTAAATITGTAPNYVLNLTIPRGDTGTVNAHTHPIADITATGTKDATTYLRGDGTWSVPTGTTPSAHTHLAADISNATTVGRSVLTAVDAPTARTAIGAGTSSLVIGTTSTTAKAGDYSPPADGAAGAATMRTLGTGATQAAAGNDSRLSDARTPVAHTHTAANISDSTTVGRSVMTAVDAAAARTAIGAGTSSLVIGTTSTTAKAGDYAPPSDAVAGTASMRTLGTGAQQAAAGNDARLSDARTPVAHTHTAANISDSTAVGRSVIVAVDAAAARTAIGAGTSSLALGTVAGTAAAGNDSRLSDARTPTAHSHPVTDLTATGRRNKNTTLRGDNTWGTSTGHPELYNVNADSLRNIRLLFARARSDIAAKAPLTVLGASVNQGVGGSGAPGAYGFLATRSIWAKMGVIPSGTGWVPAWTNAADPRWVSVTFPNPVLTQMYRQSTASGQQMTFQSDIHGPIVEVALLGDSGPVTISIDGVAQTVTGTGGTAGTVNIQRYTAQANMNHRIIVTASSATAAKVLAVRVGSDKYGLEYHGWGLSGGASVQIKNTGSAVGSPGWALSRLNPGPGVVAIGADVWLNDGGTAANTATTKANIGQAIADAQAANNQVILVFPPAPNPTANATADWNAWQAECYNLADQYNVPLLDMTARWGSYANAQAFGYMTDNVHPSDLGYSDFAAAFAGLLTHGSEVSSDSADLSYRPLTLLNGFTDLGGDFARAGYWKDSSGFVHFTGVINAPAAATNLVIAVMPVGYRPGRTHVFGLHNGGTPYVSRIDVTLTGNVPYVFGPSSTFVTLDGIIYKAEE